jgi:SCP-2 sterol transfer family
MPMDLPPRERSLRGQKLLRAGLIGPGDEGVVQDPEAIAIMFDTIRRGAITDGMRPGTTIEWDFADAAPWHLVLDNGGSRAVPGRAAHADLTLRCAFSDWADVMAGRQDPRRLMLTRRLRPKGSPRVLLALPKVFG